MVLTYCQDHSQHFLGIMLISPCLPKSLFISLENTIIYFKQQTFSQDQDTPREGSLLLYPILGVNLF